MATDPDAMWKPGYVPSGSDRPGDPDPVSPVPRSSGEGRAHQLPRPAGIGAEIAFSVANPPAAGPTRSSRRVFAVAAATAIVVALAAAVIVTRPDQASPDVGEISAVDERSIPATVGARWTTRLPGTGSAISTGLELHGQDLVVVVVDDGSRDRTSITGLDAATGELRWRRSFVFSPPEVRILDVIGERIVVEQVSPASRKLFALTTTDGATAWEHEASDGTVNVILGGTALVASIIRSADDPELVRTDFLEPATGVVSGSVRGRPLTSDLSGTWLIGDADSIAAVDLSAGWTEPVTLSNPGITGDEALASIDNRYVVLDALGSLAEFTVDADDGRGTRRSLTIDGSGLSELDSIFPAGGPTFVGVGPGVVVGAQLEGDIVRQTWQVQASVRTVGVTPQGVVLALSEAGAGFMDGVDFIVVDAVTGERLAASGPAPSYDQLPLIVGDGFIITQAIVGGRERIGYSLEGTELWRLPVSGTLRVGDGIVATLNNTPSGFEVAIYGPDELGPGDTVGGND